MTLPRNGQKDLVDADDADDGRRGPPPLFAPLSPQKDCGKYGLRKFSYSTYVLIQGQMLLHSDSPIRHL